MDLEQKVFDMLQKKIKTNQLVLPSMPDVFLQVKKIVDDPSSNVGNIASVITRDPSLTARILKVQIMRCTVVVLKLPTYN